MKGFITGLFGENAKEKQVVDPTAGIGIIVKKIVAITPGNAAIIKDLLGLETALPKNYPAMTALMGLEKDTYRQAQKDGHVYLDVNGKYRTSAWSREDTSDPVSTALIIREENGNDGYFRLVDILAGGPAMYAMVVELPCCEGADSVLAYFKQQGEYKWKLVQSEKALEQNMLEDFQRRRVTIGQIEGDDGNKMIDETIKHLKGIPCDCGDKNRFGAAYREPR